MPTDKYVTAYVPTDYAVTASIPTANSVSDLNGSSRTFGGLPKGTTNENKRLTKISITDEKNEITSIVYQKKTELYGKELPVGFLQNKIDEVSKKYNLPNNHKIMKTLISQIIATAKHHAPYGKGKVFHIR